MKVILAEDVVGLGDIGETVSVRPGYARNFLIPKGSAFEIGTKSAGAVEHRKRQIESKKNKLKGSAEQRAEELRNLSLETALRVGSGGKVFGSVGPKEVARLLEEAGFEIDRRRVTLAEPIKKIGTHFVSVKLHPEISAQVKLKVAKLSATPEQESEETRGAKEAIEAASEIKEDFLSGELEVPEEEVAEEEGSEN